MPGVTGMNLQRWNGSSDKGRSCLFRSSEYEQVFTLLKGITMSNDLYQFLGIFPIGDSDPLHLPVRDLEGAISFYEQSLGFTILSRQETPYKEVLLQRDQVKMGLAENGGNPEEHSCYLSVSTLDALFQELQNRQLDISPLRLDDHEGQPYRVFFLRDPDGLCFCFGQKQETSA